MSHWRKMFTEDSWIWRIWSRPLWADAGPWVPGAGDFTVPRGRETSPPGKTSLGSSCLPVGRSTQGSQLHSAHCCPHLGLGSHFRVGEGQSRDVSLSTQGCPLRSVQGHKSCRFSLIPLVAPLRFPLAQGISAMRRSVNQTRPFAKERASCF